MHDVFACYLTSGQTVEHSFMTSLISLQLHDLKNDRRLYRDQVWVKKAGAGGIFQGRNDLTARFLRTDAQWMWMIDSDMGFDPDVLDRLLTTASYNPDASMAGALCFSFDGERPAPTIFGHDGVGFKRVTGYAKGSTVKAAGTGAACVLIHRTVMEKVEQEAGPQWWTNLQSADGQWLGEDLSFFLRANACGYRLIVDTAIKTTHAKTLHISEEHYEMWGRS